MCIDVTVEVLEMEFLGQSKHAFGMLVALIKLSSQELCQLIMCERVCFPQRGVCFYRRCPGAATVKGGLEVPGAKQRNMPA